MHGEVQLERVGTGQDGVDWVWLYGKENAIRQGAVERAVGREETEREERGGQGEGGAGCGIEAV